MLNTFKSKFLTIIFTLFWLQLSQNQSIVIPKYRRFFIKFLNFVQKDYNYIATTTCCNGAGLTVDKCLKPCARTVRATLQGTDVFSRDLGDIATPDGGMFLMDILLFNDTNPSVFKSPLILKVEIVETATNKVLLSFSKNNINVAPNSERAFPDLKFANDNTFNLFVSYRCDGYVGYNCQFPCDTNNPAIDCEFTTGLIMCTNGNRNPPLCTNIKLPCNNSRCFNGGKCEMSSVKDFYCECPPGFEGAQCEIPICTIPCAPDNGECSGNNACKCFPGFTGARCEVATCDGYTECGLFGSCMIKENSHICNCDSFLYGGDKCDKPCKSDCIYGACFFDGTETRCICDQFFTGEFCDAEIITLAPVYESGYIPAYKQKYIIIAVTFGLLLFVLVLFSVVSYYKFNATRNRGIIQRTQYVLSQINAPMTGVINTLNQPSQDGPGMISQPYQGGPGINYQQYQGGLDSTNQPYQSGPRTNNQQYQGGPRTKNQQYQGGSRKNYQQYQGGPGTTNQPYQGGPRTNNQPNQGGQSTNYQIGQGPSYYS